MTQHVCLSARHATRRQTRLRPTVRPAQISRSRTGGATVWSASAMAGPRLHSSQKDWVSRGGALTKHLAQFGTVSVRVVGEGIGNAWPDERVVLLDAKAARLTARKTSTRLGALSASALALALRRPVWFREVVLSIDGLPCVAAHSVTPLAASRAQWKSMRLLRTRPLAELLYKDRSVRRSALVSRRGGGYADPLHGLIERATLEAPLGALLRAEFSEASGASARGFIVRRSLFERHGAPLMITECFLPAFWQRLFGHDANVLAG